MQIRDGRRQAPGRVQPNVRLGTQQDQLLVADDRDWSIDGVIDDKLEIRCESLGALRRGQLSDLAHEPIVLRATGLKLRVGLQGWMCQERAGVRVEQRVRLVTRYGAVVVIHAEV